VYIRENEYLKEPLEVRSQILKRSMACPRDGGGRRKITVEEDWINQTK